uniref:(California timema) hypothetical protein n=1 Tax=Timema californicum TaxID=61474 RepID=A0A7R9JEE4_TIMCA|nr:unnamed protein product [Timema californicum]
MHAAAEAAAADLLILAVTSALVVRSSAQFVYGNGYGPLFLDGTSYPRLIPIKYSSPLSSVILSAADTTAVYPGFNSGQMYVSHCRRAPWSGHYDAGRAYSDPSPGDVMASSTANRDDSKNVSSTADISASVNRDYYCCGKKPAYQGHSSPRPKVVALATSSSENKGDPAIVYSATGASVGTAHGYSDHGKVSTCHGNRYPSLSDKQALAYSAANSGDSDVASAADVDLSLDYSTHSDGLHYPYYPERYDPEQSTVAVSTSSTVNSYDSAASFTSSADTGVGLSQISLPHVAGPSCDGYDNPGYAYPPGPKYEATVVTSTISSSDSAATSSEGGNFRYPPHSVYPGWGGYFDLGLCTSFAPHSASSNGIPCLYSVYGGPNPYY